MASLHTSTSRAAPKGAMKGLITPSNSSGGVCFDKLKKVSCKDATEMSCKSNSILNTQLRELEAMSSKWARLYCRMLRINSSDNTLSGTECTCKSATSKYGMHLQKCNLKIWIYSPEWAPSIEYNGSIVPKWTEKILSRSVLAEGECEFWDHLCPGFAPNPLLFLLGFLSWSIFGRSLRPSMERFSASCFEHAAYNACITSEGEWRKTRHPP